MAGNQTTTSAGPGPDDPGDPDDRGYEVPDRPWLVHGAIVVAFAIFLSMVALLYVRWAGTTAPNSTMIFSGDGRFDGVQVRVDGPALDKSMTQQLSQHNGYQAKFAVPAGTYLVRINGRDGKLLAQDSAIAAREGVGVQYDLTKLLRVEGGAGAATTRPQ